MSEPALLAVQDLELRAGPKRLIDALSLRIEAGQFWAVVGANGVGKTTLLGALAGLVAPQRGQIELLGRPLSSHHSAELARLRGFLPQQVDALYGMNVLQAVLLGRHPHVGGRGWRLWEDDADVALARVALAQVDLAGFESRAMHSLSGGERQRSAIACVLVQAPRLYLLDEPLAHLDLRHQHAVMRLLRALADRGDNALVASVHDLSMAARFATHALVLGGPGRSVAGPAGEVLTEAALSAAFGHPVRRLTEGETIALVGR